MYNVSDKEWVRIDHRAGVALVVASVACSVGDTYEPSSLIAAREGRRSSISSGFIEALRIPFLTMTFDIAVTASGSRPFSRLHASFLPINPQTSWRVSTEG